jgi:hypothetical protein
VVAELDDLARLALEDDDHAAPNLCCGNCHKGRLISVLKNIAWDTTRRR